MVTASTKLKDTCSLEVKLWQKAETLLCQRRSVNQSYSFSSSHVWVWDLDHKESWVLKNWCFWAMVLEKTLESPMDSKEIKPVNPKGNQPWIFTGRTDANAEAEAPILWPPDVKSQLIGKDPDAEKDWGQEGKKEMVGWTTNSMNVSLSKLLETAKNTDVWYASVHGVPKSWTWLSDWTTTMCVYLSL